MGIYYAAVDINRKLVIEAPDGFAIKYPGVCHPANPFSAMVVMKNCQGYNFEIVNDMGYDIPNGFINITREVYMEYKEVFSFLKEPQDSTRFENE